MNEKLVEVKVHDLSSDGMSVGSMGGKIVFLNGGLPGEKVLASVTQSKRNYNRAVVRKILTPSDKRQNAPCPHFSRCGGCAWQDLDYDEQLKMKQRQTVETLKRIGSLENSSVKKIVACEEPFYYRNKMEFSFHVTQEGGFTLGLHHQGRFDEIFDVEDCRLQSKTSNEIVSTVREFVRKHDIPVYDVKNHHGMLRFLVIREGKKTGQTMVNIVTSFGSMPMQREFVGLLTDRFEGITTIVHNQNGQKSNIAVGEIETVLYGPGFIEEDILGRRFRIRANSFFQTNSLQTEKLYRTALDLLSADGTDSLLDLYCGTGTIGILASDSVDHVVGIELSPEAISAARENARLNGCHNIEFVQGDVRPILRTDMERYGRFSLFVLDPPRAGIHPRVLARILMLAPKRIVYISCNPATFARDAEKLVLGGYEIPEIQPVDMFPHTRHVELVGLFTQKSSACL